MLRRNDSLFYITVKHERTLRWQSYLQNVHEIFKDSFPLRLQSDVLEGRLFHKPLPDLNELNVTHHETFRLIQTEKEGTGI